MTSLHSQGNFTKPNLKTAEHYVERIKGRRSGALSFPENNFILPDMPAPSFSEIFFFLIKERDGFHCYTAKALIG
jgi:hypothetical protein